MRVLLARVSIGCVALDSKSTHVHIHIAPYDATTQTWVNKKRVVAPDAVCIGSGHSQGGAKLRALSYV